MLASIVKLLGEHNGALSVQEISLALAIESSALHPMLEMLERKGRIRKVDLPCKSGCGGGCTCSDSMIFYKAA
ncbi:MAG: helix-turn-helix domain-containing protein [Pontiellaceae bacterium]|nr:helix-turn-helix domain-containing protein [Pontiellaceae bacterium]MBN2783627.1 helix-turn-helix domain-containing protein [Pontiellaceae bacterium]